MDPVTLTFLVVGGVGVVLLLVAVLAGDIGDFGHPDADGIFSLPALCALLGGAGFVGAIPAALTEGRLGTLGRVLLSVAIGLAAALPLAYGAVRLSAGLMHMRTDRTLVDSDLIGAQGRVITAISAPGLGEVRLDVAGQQLKYYARSARPLAAGTPVYVIDTPSPTSVEVVSTAPDPLDPIPEEK